MSLSADRDLEPALAKAAKVRLVFSDVDGVLTDGGMYYGVEGEALKRFNTRDGMGVELLGRANIEVVLVTGEDSAIVAQRAAKLHIGEIYQGIKDKRSTVETVSAARGFGPEVLAFIGDDVNDLEAMRYCGLGATVADGADAVKSIADYVCVRKGGEGAFREFAELILTAQGKL